MLTSVPPRLPPSRRHVARPAAGLARGLSLVELMVGIAVGLFVTATAALLTSTQLANNRQLLVETQLQQDLRATIDIVSRELRRASYAGNAFTFVSLLDSTVPPAPSWAADIEITGGSGASAVDYAYNLNTQVFGLRLSGNVLQRRVGSAGTWQPLTDPAVVLVDSFTVTPGPQAEERLACPSLCADGTEACWPRMQIRWFTVDITARNTVQPEVQRSMRSQVRVRNDVVRFNTQAPAQVCP